MLVLLNYFLSFFSEQQYFFSWQSCPMMAMWWRLLFLSPFYRGGDRGTEVLNQGSWAPCSNPPRTGLGTLGRMYSHSFSLTCKPPSHWSLLFVLTGMNLYWIWYSIACILCFDFWAQGIRDLSSLTRDCTQTPCIERQSLNRWTTREVPKWP